MINRCTLFALPLLLLLAVPPVVFGEENSGSQDAAVSGPLAAAAPDQVNVIVAGNSKSTPAPTTSGNAKKPQPSASAAPSSSGNPTLQPSPSTGASPSASPDAMQALVASPTPPPLSAPTQPVQSDPLKFLDGFKGDYDTDLFTGSATYSFPLAIPPGRGKATPAVSLNYSSSGLNMQSLVGYGWSLPTNAIFRSTAYGTNNLYNRDDYAADIFGNYAQLIVTDTTNKIYAVTGTPYNKTTFYET